MSVLMFSANSSDSLLGFVSSRRRWHSPPNFFAMPKSTQIALAWPMWR